MKALSLCTFFVGVLTLVVGTTIKNVWLGGTGSLMLITSIVIAGIWRAYHEYKKLADQAQKDAKTKFNMCDQMADMLVAALKASHPQLKAVKQWWGKSEDGTHTGTAVDVVDGDKCWSINFDASRAHYWVKADGKEGVYDPAKWEQELSYLLRK